MRLNFDIATDTGTWADISPNLFGTLRQLAWKPSTGDTGGDLQLVMLPMRLASFTMPAAFAAARTLGNSPAS